MKTVLFICVQNSARSQMAEGLGRHFAAGNFKFASAGSNPSDRVHPMAIAAMAEIGIDISGHKPKSMDEFNLEEIDHIIALCAEEQCPAVGKPIESWALPDPANTGDTEQDELRRFRKTRDAIREKILELSREVRLN